MLDAFLAFIKRRQANFVGLARATRNQSSPDDLKQEAWIMALEIGERQQRQINFGDVQDEQLILGALNIKYVKRGTKSVRYALSIDQTVDGDDGEINPWANSLVAQETADPIISLMQLESALDEKTLLANSYSQAVAYVRIFVHFKNYRDQVCAHLCISGNTLRNRVHTAAQSVRVQASLFDGVERIADNFMPPRGRLYQSRAAGMITSAHISHQYCALLI